MLAYKLNIKKVGFQSDEKKCLIFFLVKMGKIVLIKKIVIKKMQLQLYSNRKFFYFRMRIFCD